MKIRSIDVWTVKIPFSTSINHNLKDRGQSHSVVLAVTTTDGLIGYGEGTPRTYVTGESTAQIIRQFSRVMSRNALLSIDKLEDIQVLSKWLRAYYKMPAMVTALELALLDLMGQYRSCSVASLFPVDEPYVPIYSGILPFVSTEKRAEWLQLIKGLELPAVKIKVGRASDLDTLREAREILGEDIDIRVDANRAWSFTQAREMIDKMEDFGVSSVEEPLMVRDLSRTPELAESVRIPLMLDESIVSRMDAEKMIRRIDPEMLRFNLKLSKLGGFFAADELHQLATENGIPCQLGCHVGETAILSSAGRLFAQTHQLKYLEGAYGPFFMEDDIVNEPPYFGTGGKAPMLNQIGLDVRINPDKLRHFGRRTENIVFREQFALHY